VKKILAIVSFILLIASLGLAAGVNSVNSSQARTMIAKTPGLVLLDVRTPDEFRQAHLHGALLIPLYELQNRLREVPRDKPLLVYCSVGARSANAAGYLSSQGFKNVYHMADGLVGWYRNGYPLEGTAVSR
jgi:rhodanese-related sulfurtransferase